MTTDENTPADAGGLDEIFAQHVERGAGADVQPVQQPEAGEHDAGADGAEHGEPKRLSGAARNKVRTAFLHNEVAERDRKIAQLESVLRERDAADEAAASEHIARKVRDRGHEERIKAVKDVSPDWDRLMARMNGFQIGDGTADEITRSDQSGLVAVYFAARPDELRAFDAMSPRDQAKTIGRLEATLKFPEARKATSAPPPLRFVKGGPSPRDQTAEVNAYLDKTYGKDRRR